MSKTVAVFSLKNKPEVYALAEFSHPLNDDKPTRTLFIMQEVYRDMGSPEQITVTIEPGNQLNEGNNSNA